MNFSRQGLSISKRLAPEGSSGLTFHSSEIRGLCMMKLKFSHFVIFFLPQEYSGRSMNKTIYVNLLILKIWQILKRVSLSHFIKQKLFLLLKCAYCQLCKKKFEGHKKCSKSIPMCTLQNPASRTSSRPFRFFSRCLFVDLSN